MFRHVNGKVRIRAPGVAFECAAHEFAAIEPAFTGLSERVIERRYDPDAPGGRPKHVLITADHRQIGGPVPWPEGDAMLAKAADYPALHAAAFPQPESASPPTVDTRIHAALVDGSGAVTRREMNALKAWLRGGD